VIFLENIFADKEETLKMVKGSYKKLKSHLYYDKTLLFTKKRLAILESDRELFDNTLLKISDNLCDENMEYFQGLIDKIDFKILPKKFTSKTDLSDIIQGSISHEQDVQKVNFFIDMPIELFIVDYLWTLLLGKITNDHPEIFKCSAATKFKKSVFNSNKDLINGIDFASNRSFEPYFNLYSCWRKGAFNMIERSYSSTETVLLCLDLKSFYYSVEFNFCDLPKYLRYDPRLPSFDFLTTVVEKIYFTYTRIISSYKMGIRNKETTCVFPIGVTSAVILRELYLEKFDKLILDKLAPLYFSRYVDDILLVIKVQDDKTIKNKDDAINYLISSDVASISNDKELKFMGYGNIKIQKEKINCFSFPKNNRPIFLSIYANAIQMNSSEYNLLPDEEILNKSFEQAAYNIQNLDFSSKLRDLGFLHNNNYNATRFTNSLQRLIKNTTIDIKIMAKYLSQIEEFYKGSQSLEFSSNWKAIFELFLLCKEEERARDFYSKAKSEINKLNFDKLDYNEVLKKNKNKLLKRLKQDLKEKLIISAALASALESSFGRQRKDVASLAEKFRNSNLLNHNIVAYPLLNYSRAHTNTLTEMDLDILWKSNNNIFDLDEVKLELSPRYIHSTEFFIASFLRRLCNKNKKINTENELFNEYIKYNNLGEYLKNPFEIEEISNMNKMSNYRYNIKDKLKSNPKVAVVNTKISEKEVLSSLSEQAKNLTLDNKLKLFKILNTAKKENVDILVFPEFYFPTSWIMDMAIFAVKNQISIVTGLQYLTVGYMAFNNVCNVIPVLINKSFAAGLLLVREKNYYAPKEKISLSQLGYRCKDVDKPVYYIINNGKYGYSTILCYEFTDILSRANMKRQIEALFVPQLNRDTNYFSAIVEASARDLHCFVIQANTSAYGDSRITAPYISIKKNILQIKGGETDVVMIATLDMVELLKRRRNYTDKVMRSVNDCFKCYEKNKNKNKNKPYTEFIKKCQKCDKVLKDEYIKGLPPNFRL